PNRVLQVLVRLRRTNAEDEGAEVPPFLVRCTDLAGPKWPKRLPDPVPDNMHLVAHGRRVAANRVPAGLRNRHDRAGPREGAAQEPPPQNPLPPGEPGRELELDEVVDRDDGRR